MKMLKKSLFNVFLGNVKGNLTPNLREFIGKENITDIRRIKIN